MRRTCYKSYAGISQRNTSRIGLLCKGMHAHFKFIKCLVRVSSKVEISKAIDSTSQFVKDEKSYEKFLASRKRVS